MLLWTPHHRSFPCWSIQAGESRDGALREGERGRCGAFLKALKSSSLSRDSEQSLFLQLASQRASFSPDIFKHGAGRAIETPECGRRGPAGTGREPR